MYQVLFATDFSARDHRAFKLACQFAKAWHAKLLIAHIDTSEDSPEYERTTFDPNRRLYHVHPQDLGISYEHILRRGDPYTMIREIEVENDADLIVLGTHGRKGLERIFAGSVSEKVIRSANCPVVTVRDPASRMQHDGEHISRILVPIDFSAHGYAALDFASLLAHSIDASLTILHVSNSTPPDRQTGESKSIQPSQQLWHQLCQVKPKNMDVKFTHKLLFGSPNTRITEFASSHHFDIIVLGTHGRSGVGRVLMGSVAEQIVRNANCAVVTAKPSDKQHPVLCKAR